MNVKSKGHVANCPWLWTKARKLQTEIDPTVEIKYHVIVRFLQRTKIRMRSKQKNNKKEKVPQLMKWRATLREKCIRTGADEPSYDDKWGRHKPIEEFNVDQCPLPFNVHGKKTYDYVSPGRGSTRNTWIFQPGAGTEKRQCVLQVMFRPKECQTRLANNFAWARKTNL